MIKKTERGFTLIEMLIVVVIIGILAAIVLPKLSDQSSKARKKACASQIRNINTTLELISFDENIAADSIDGTFAGTEETWSGATYLGSIPGSVMKKYFPDGGMVCPYVASPNNVYKIEDGRVNIDAAGGDHTACLK